MKPFSWDEITEETVTEWMKRKMFWGQNLMIVRAQLAPNGTVPVHDHVSEQITIVVEGSIIMHFNDGREAVLKQGDMVVVPSNEPHGVTIGPAGAVALDVFSPIREDFIEGKISISDASDGEPYKQLHGFLRAKGIKVALEDLREVPLELLARYTYEKECITMGQLRKILGIDKDRAKAMLREWKHGDDHSESSLRRKLERIITLPVSVLPFALKDEK
jgi:quercetin dioxygenase-like cupin family protein